MSFLVALSFLTRVPLGSWGVRAWERSEAGRAGAVGRAGEAASGRAGEAASGRAGEAASGPAGAVGRAGEAAAGRAGAGAARLPGPLARAAPWFPVVGALVGAVVGGVAAVAAQALGTLVGACLGIAAGVVLTGALHLDGLADCADGCGGADRASRLRIMKDHAVGVYGTAAVVLDLLLSVALLERLLAQLPPGRVVLVVAAVHAVARAGLLPVARGLRYARGTSVGTGSGPNGTDTGTGRMLIDGLSRGHVTATVLVALALSLPLTWAADEILGGGVMVAGAAIGSLGVACWARRMLGGVTGDVMGACVEVATLAGLIGLLIVH